MLEQNVEKHMRLVNKASYFAVGLRQVALPVAAAPNMS